MSDIRRFITGSAALSSSSSSSSAAKKKADPILEAPRDLDAHVLPPALQRLVDSQSGQEERALWLVPGVLSWGEPPTERLDPYQWTHERGIRIVVDTAQTLRDDERYRRQMARAGAVLVHLPLNSKLKVPPSTVNDMISLARVLEAIVREGKAVPAERRTIAVHLCDAHSGGSAATLAAPLLALATGASLIDASVAISRMWRDNTARGRNTSGGTRVFPEGEWLKRAVVAVHSRLRERPLGGSTGTALAAAVAEEAAIMDVQDTAATALRIVDIDQRWIRQPPPFTRTEPLRAITWAMHNNQWQEQRAHQRFDELIAQARKTKEEATGGGEDDDDDSWPRRKARRIDNDDDDNSDDDCIV